jgi:hypothetical protein
LNIEAFRLTNREINDIDFIRKKTKTA